MYAIKTGAKFWPQVPFRYFNGTAIFVFTIPTLFVLSKNFDLDLND